MIDAVADIRVPAILCAALLYVVALLCFFGLICRNYRDNWAQTIGLIVMVIWSLGRADYLSDRENLTLQQWTAVLQWQTLPKAETVSAYQLLGAFGMVMFGLGTAWKVWKYRHSNTNPNGVAE